MGSEATPDAEPAAGDAERRRLLNVNVGVLGHVDSGKTSLVRALSTQLSTAALDKHPESAVRGITLDLGFSSFTTGLPPQLEPMSDRYDGLQFTLVDCPGHASLIRTVLGGAQIIDLMLLVIDVNKGIQTQTAECLVVGEITTDRLIVVLNKCDMLPADTRAAAVEKMVKKLSNTFKATRFAGCPMVPVSARPGGAATMAEDRGDAELPPEGMDPLVAELLSRVPELNRRADEPLLYAVDHCFPIKGQGTVLTGTVLQGSISVGQTVEFPALKVERKVKSMQMFKRPVRTAVRGDRLGVCVTQLDAKALERGLVCEPGSVPTFGGCVVACERIRFFRQDIRSKSKFHVTIGHQTVMAEVTFFGEPLGAGAGALEALAEAARGETTAQHAAAFSFDADYVYCDELLEPPARAAAAGKAGGAAGAGAGDAATRRDVGRQWAILAFETPVTCPRDALLIGSRLDVDVHTSSCRLAFHGRVAQVLDPSKQDEMARLRIFKWKRREGSVDRYQDEHTVIGKGMFKKETDMTNFTGMRVRTAQGEEGTVQGTFGKGGKFKVHFPGGVEAVEETGEPRRLTMEFKRFYFDKSKKMVQN